MLKLSVIDHNTKRLDNLLETIKSLDVKQLEPTGYYNIWGNDKKEIVDWLYLNRDNIIAAPDLLFIHTNNKFARLYIEEFCLDKFVVIYSGGDDLSKVLNNNEKHFIYQQPVGKDANPGWDLKAFIEAVINNEDNIFEKLVGFDIQLETKLDFLYQCLSKEEIRSSYDFEPNNKELNIAVIKSKQDELRQMIGNSEKINEYIYKLTELRNELIPTINETDN